MSKVSQAQMDATTRYEQVKYDKLLVRLPKGTKDKISSTGRSLNGFITDAVNARLLELQDPSATTRP